MTEAGQRYGGRYEITSPIASGGMAEVFLARDQLLDRQVALKVLHPEFSRDQSFIERFRREARAAASLNDPRIVSVFDWGADDGTYYIVMEFVDGSSLRQLIENEGPLEPERAAEIASDVCAALHFAHQQGIVHRDIKPANIAITPGGQTKVMDFGIARRSRDSGQTVTQTGTVIGTAAYLSPEQAQGLSVDARSDVYSTGIVLYEMLTGDVPFKGETAVAVAYKHVKEIPAPPSQQNAAISSDLDAVVMKALAKVPENRYQSADELRADLARVIAGRPVEATPLLAEDEKAVVPRRRDDATMVVPSRAGEERTAIIPTHAYEPDRRRTLVYVLTYLLFFGLIIGGIALAFSLFGGGGAKIVVPNVVGVPEDEAETILDDAGLDSKVIAREFHDSVPNGSVISQIPLDGEKADEGSTVDLVVSKGPERIEVPDVVGKNQDEAKTLIEAAALKLGSVRSEVSKTVEPGIVISQNPAGGEDVERGSSVNLVVSSGKQTVKVPDVRGFTEERAREILLGRNLDPVVKETCNTSEKPGTVIEQSPAPGTEVTEDSDVTITVNRAVTVPDVEGKKEDEAKSQLESAGFTVNVVKRPALPQENKGEVVDQDPEGGTVACKGSKVTITVAA